MFEIIVEKRKAWCAEKETITTRSKGLKVHFEFSSEWDNLQRTAIFQAYSASIAVPIGEDCTVDIPESVLLHSGVKAYVGVFGTDNNGAIVIPTVSAELGNVLAGSHVEQASNYDVPSPALTAQILELARQAQYAAALAVAAKDSDTLSFSVSEDGHLIETRSDETDGTITYDIDLGPVTAYGIVKAAGYEGTKDDFINLILTNKAIDDDIREAIEIAATAGASAAAAAASAANAETTASNLADTVATINESVSQLRIATDGKQAQHITTTVTLDSGVQTWTKSVPGVTVDNTVICSPAPDSYTTWADAGVRCSGQSEDTLTFAADNSTASEITVNVLILN